MFRRFFTHDERGRELSALLALRKFDLATGADVVRWSMDALAGDLDTPSLRDLAGLPRQPNEFEVDDHLRAFAREVGDEPPAPLDFYPRFIADKILRGEVLPFDGATTLYRFYLAAKSEAGLSKWSGLDTSATLAAQGICGSVAEVERQIREAARELLDVQV